MSWLLACLMLSSLVPSQPASAVLTSSSRTAPSLSAARRLTADGATLWRAGDGLFYVNALINGVVVKLVVDTGASMTVLSPEDARRAGVTADVAARTEIADTAGGSSPMTRVILADVQIGETAAHDVSAVVASQPLVFSLLGQNWLSRIGSVTIEGDRMVLR